mmetsp:Transcript_83209/g.179547  ORF Transcript_83209/g.179547 Transcript_83209/m.179547 type:complete len:181 (-) Transcript_83209:335-877(-)
MPITLQLSHRIMEHLAAKRKSGEIKWLRPDAKSQVTFEYLIENGVLVPQYAHTILVSHQHDKDVSNEEITETITREIKSIVPEKYIREDTRFIINPSKHFVQGGPHADAGLTGRKIIVDTYGGHCPHGGGAFSGKDPSKVDRSAAYAARWIAKSLVNANLCKRVEIQISYAIGIAEPLQI